MVKERVLLETLLQSSLKFRKYSSKTLPISIESPQFPARVVIAEGPSFRLFAKSLFWLTISQRVLALFYDVSSFFIT